MQASPVPTRLYCPRWTGTKGNRRVRLWIELEAPKKTGPSGVGKDNYNWYLQKVHLVPYDWDQQETLLRRELERARHPWPRGIPEPKSPAAGTCEHARGLARIGRYAHAQAH